MTFFAVNRDHLCCKLIVVFDFFCLYFFTSFCFEIFISVLQKQLIYRLFASLYTRFVQSRNPNSVMDLLPAEILSLIFSHIPLKHLILW
jgi:hypothetical protein